MRNRYKNLITNKRISTPSYYRLSLQDLLPEVNKIIYLDGDTLVFEDLKELFELDMKGKIIMGFLDNNLNAIESFGFKNATIICSGVLLIDLEGLRKFGYTQKVEKFIFKNWNKLTQHDQTVINVVLQDKIAPIPPKYGVWAFKSKYDAQIFLNMQLPHLKYNEQEFFNAMEHPAILHFVWPKPFWMKHTRFENDYWKFANLTGHYNEIYSNSPIPK